jgi:peptidoglycan hydrolase CwlO-like protein
LSVSISLYQIIKKKEENISNIKEQKNRIQDDIGYIRKKINDHFDKIEKQLNNTLNRAHESCIKTLEDGIKQIKERVKKMDVWYKDIETLKGNIFFLFLDNFIQLRPCFFDPFF